MAQLALLGAGAIPKVPNLQRESARPPKQHTGPCGCYSWYLDADTGSKCKGQKLTFFLYCLIGLLGVVFFIVYLTDESEMFNSGFILACALAILMSILAVSGFRDVIRLQQTINDLVSSTKALAQERDKIRKEVDNLQNAHRKLQGIERELDSSSTALRRNFGEFVDWNKEVQRESEKNSTQAKDINRDFKNAIKQYHAMLIQNELAIADKAFHHILGGAQSKKGLDQQEFEDLLHRLPPRWKDKFQELDKSFEDFAGDDEIINQGEFRKFMKAMAEEIAKCDLSPNQLAEMGIKSDRMAGGRDDDEKDGN